MRILPTLPPPSICEAILQLCLPHHIPLLVSGGQNIKTMRANFDSDFYSGKYVFLIPSHQSPILKHKGQKINSLPENMISSQANLSKRCWTQIMAGCPAQKAGQTHVRQLLPSMMVPPWCGRWCHHGMGECILLWLNLVQPATPSVNMIPCHAHAIRSYWLQWFFWQ